MKYKAKLSGEIPDPNNVMYTLKLEVSVESDDMDETARRVWKLKEKVENNIKETSNVIFADGKNRQLPEEIMKGTLREY